MGRFAGAGAGRGVGKWRSRPPGGLLHGIRCDLATAGHGLWPPIRVWHLPTEPLPWLAAGKAGQLAPASGPLGGSATERESRNRAELLFCAARREPAGGCWTTVHSVRYPV